MFSVNHVGGIDLLYLPASKGGKQRKADGKGGATGARDCKGLKQHRARTTPQNTCQFLLFSQMTCLLLCYDPNMTITECYLLSVMPCAKILCAKCLVKSIVTTVYIPFPTIKKVGGWMGEKEVV